VDPGKPEWLPFAVSTAKERAANNRKDSPQAGRAHPKDPLPAWYGHSVGHWEGDTLVVDRIGFNEQSWLDQESHPHSEKRVSDPAHLRVHLSGVQSGRRTPRREVVRR
jgi:hypothetical protein